MHYSLRAPSAYCSLFFGGLPFIQKEKYDDDVNEEDFFKSCTGFPTSSPVYHDDDDDDDDFLHPLLSQKLLHEGFLSSHHSIHCQNWNMESVIKCYFYVLIKGESNPFWHADPGSVTHIIVCNELYPMVRSLPTFQDICL